VERYLEVLGEVERAALCMKFLGVGGTVSLAASLHACALFGSMD